MKNYVIINGVNSLTITGLAISKLPSISKPPLRVMTEEINGRDGDLITELGYGAYDKELVIGLYGNYDINEVIGFFNQEGTIVFSNEDDKYYNFKIINQIDYEALIKFRTATINLHCQPFKYPLIETPEEITTEYVEDEGETLTLNDTKIAPLNIDLKGNTTQNGTPTPSSPVNVNVVSGDNEVKVINKNLLEVSLPNATKNGITFTNNGDGTITLKGTATANADFRIDQLTPGGLERPKNYNGTYTLSCNELIPNVELCTLAYNNGSYTAFMGSITSSTPIKTQTINITNGFIYVLVRNGVSIPNGITLKPMLLNGSYTIQTLPNFVPYTSQNYPLYLGVENLYEGSQDFSGTWVNTDKWLDDTQTYNGLAVKKRYNSWSGLYKEINVVQGETYTYSFYAKSDTSRQIAIYLTGGTGGMTPQSNSFTTTTDWVRYSITFNVLNTGTIRARVENTSDSTTNATYICGYQLEKNSKANSYTPYGITPIELNKIGTYQDYIYKTDKWYLHKEVGKVVLNGSENWEDRPNFSACDRFVLNYILRNTNFNGYSNYFEIDNGINLSSNYPRLRFNNTQIVVNFSAKGTTTITQFKEWLSTHNTIGYYVYATPTEEEITNTTLINQLEQLKGAMSYEGQTNISQVNNDLPFILKVKGTKEGSGEGIINNIGNIYAKPIIELEGTGNIGIYKNGTQYFEVDMSSDNEITIDTENMEAYHDGVLKNRKVIGDYNKFTIDEGNNNIEITGELTKATISNYTRWL